jgi:hypothetical protein
MSYEYEQSLGFEPPTHAAPSQPALATRRVPTEPVATSTASTPRGPDAEVLERLEQLGWLGTPIFGSYILYAQMPPEDWNPVSTAFAGLALAGPIAGAWLAHRKLGPGVGKVALGAGLGALAAGTVVGVPAYGMRRLIARSGSF